MQLKKLEVFGFKSFSDKTSFVFGKGITVVVGPNGCGKSNVVDAIKWILGEQKAKALRGNEMADVIFNGTNKRPSMGYAEASLTILNDRNILPIEYKEVCITRRLYTSGESEYLINKQHCRLKDIKELFMDTGVGANCYSLIEQGKVDMLLQANAQERRFIFEEAAGISKYKSRKKETMSKLEKVEQNLLRLNDIIEEVQKQFRSVKLQASKAVKYNEYTDRLKTLSVQLSLKKYRAFKAERAGILDQLQQKEDDGQEILAKIEDMQVKNDSLQEDMDKLVSALEKLLFDQANIESKVTSTHDKIGFNQKNIEELITQKSKYEGHVITLKDRISGSENSILSLTDNLQETKEDLSEKIECLSIKESEFKQYSLECDMLLQKIDGDKKRVIDILHKESSLQNEIGSLGAERDTISNRKIKLLKRQEEIFLELEDLENEKEELKKQRDAALNNIEHLKVCSSGINEKIKTLNVETQSIVNNINSQQQLKSRKESRLEILEDLERRYEGVSSGAKVILEEAKNNNEELTGICGMVADLIRVDAAYVPAIEAVLGDKAQMIVTDSLKETIQAIDFLKRHEKGFVKFLPLNDVKLRNHDTSFDLNITGVIGKATDLVKSEERFQPLVEYIFRETIIVKDFETALTLAGNGSNGFHQIVTLNGEVVEPGGGILAGMGNTQTGLISRKVELETIKQELVKLEKEIAISMGEKNIKTNEIESLIKESEEIGSKTEAENVQKISTENGIREKDFKLDELNEEKEINESEINEIDDLLGNINQRELRLNDETKTLNDQRINLESQVIASNGEKTEKETAKANVQDQITELKVVIAQKEERKDSLNASLEKSKEELLENQDELSTTQSEISNCRERADKNENEVTNLNKLLEELENEKVELEKDIVTLKEKQNNYNEEIIVLNNQIDAYREEYRDYELEINDLRLKENEFKIQIANLEERIKDDYSVDLSEFDLANKDEIDDAFDLDGVSQEIEQLKSKIGRMGNINPDAIQEQNELEERESHLMGQMEDLQKSEKTLRDIIKKINITSRELFENTFNDVRENFHELFRKLFGGGKADIVLEEGVDILDAGIEIIAQPPGKDLRSIMLFSGGEKVMVTIALLFAVFKAKPSPFCILDEVDAALDESNISRFTHILTEFARTSQFLVITHNKNTMGVADALYGITMEEAGVSKKVSVKLKEEIRQVA